MGDCIFCKIGSGAIPSKKIYEDGHAFAILDIAPCSAGHVMVIPKIHAVTLLDLPDSEVGPLFAAVKTVVSRIDSTLGPDGFTIGINHGDVSGQTVKHLHVHIIPRRKGDGGGSIHSVVNDPPEEDAETVFLKILGK